MLVPAGCSFPTTFEILWRLALGCGIVLLLETGALLVRRFIYKRPDWRALLLGSAAFSLIGFILALIAAQFQLECENNQVYQQTLQVLVPLQFMVIPLLCITCVLLLLGIGPILRARDTVQSS